MRGAGHNPGTHIAQRIRAKPQKGYTMYRQEITSKRWKSGWMYDECILDEQESTYPFETTEQQLADFITGIDPDEYRLRNLLDRLESENIDELYILREYAPDGSLRAEIRMWESDAISLQLEKVFGKA